ncbi:hypothetical protein PIB30_016278 [Stylosanthes scabra]|uniref:Uncharacterized protein n=1 Tax=Stylosanthes scabra TaxID=79078 RepID=A0ABU6Z3V6_9FABA|nr:hypothetical protein [Stylosanthes scabra]
MEHKPHYIIYKNLKNFLPGSYGIVYIATVVDMQTWYQRVLRIIAVKTSSKPTLAYSLKKEEQILQSFSGCQEIVQCFGSEITLEGGCPVYDLFLE